MAVPSIRLALAQINTTVGDLDGNRAKVLSFVDQARRQGADLVIFPELTLTGYPPEDLLLRPQFIQDNLKALYTLAAEIQEPLVIVGFADWEKGKRYNAAALLFEGKVQAIYHKICLPNYGVFDEKRYFEPGSRPLIFHYQGVRFGLNICEDIWIPDGVTEAQAFLGDAEVILNISCSPYHAGKGREREQMLSERSRHTRTWIAYTNLVGGQDELVFDGMSFVFNPYGEMVRFGRQFEEDLLLQDVDVPLVWKIRAEDVLFLHHRVKMKSPWDLKTVHLLNGKSPAKQSSHPPTKAPSGPKPPPSNSTPHRMEYLEEIYAALVLGTRDYVRKNGFSTVVIGLSGGIDSALTATIAVDALGPEHVVGVRMPSAFTSPQSLEDAAQLASNLAIRLLDIPIHPIYQSYLKALKPHFGDRPFDVTEENIQARIRGSLLMALSNKFGWLVLTTGNKSETSVGYCTLYGDTAGGFAVIKDVPKTLVYQLATFRNQQEGREIIPQSILTKAPSAELRKDQKDEDTLPPYRILDPILELFVEKEMSPQDIVKKGYPTEIVRQVVQWVDKNEYKRRQAPPGIKITPRAFGKDRRMPITNRYRLMD